MPLFTRQRTAAPRREPTLAPASVEARDAGLYADGWGVLSGLNGHVGPGVAEGLAAVVACEGAISSAIASLPAAVYRTEGAGRVEAPDHPVSRLLRQPNPLQTWVGFAEWLISCCLRHGNAVAVIERDAAGQPSALWPVPWTNITVQVLPNGRLVFDVLPNALYGGPSLAGRYLDHEILFLRDRTDTGVIGRSRLSRAPGVIQAALGLEEYSASIWRNAAAPSGAYTLPPGVKEEGLRRLRHHVEGYITGSQNAGRILYLDPQSTFTPISAKPVDAEVLASRAFTVIECCRLYGVPPPIIQSYENNTFTNATQASIWFAVNTLTPFVRKLEAEFSRSVIDDPAYHVEISLDGLMRGDYATRWTANVAAVAAGILTRDEIRAQEGYGPLPASEAPPATTAPAPEMPRAAVQ